MESALPLPQTEVSKRWNYRHLCIAWVVGVITQLLMIPSCCYIGHWKSEVAMWFDLMILLRIIAAFVMKQTGDAWVIYCVLCYSSVIWIHIFTGAILRFNGIVH